MAESTLVKLRWHDAEKRLSWRGGKVAGINGCGKFCSLYNWGGPVNYSNHWRFIRAKLLGLFCFFAYITYLDGIIILFFQNILSHLSVPRGTWR